MNARNEHATQTIDGKFEHPIYSPKGGIEGALLRAGGEAVQVVFDPHGGPGADAFARLKGGEAVSLAVHAEGPSDKGEAAHAVYRFERLVSVDGRKPAHAAPASGAPYSGTVTRLNFARHGQANGVVLDSGHFIHTRPDGMARLALAVGDHVEAHGEARPLATGGGQVVEASAVNGQVVSKPARKTPRHG